MEEKTDLKARARAFLQDLLDVAEEIDGKGKGFKKTLLKHLKGDPKYLDKFLDRLCSLAAQLENKEKTLNVKGNVDLQLKQFGFTHEMLMKEMQRIKAEFPAVQIDAATVDDLPDPPALPQGDEDWWAGKAEEANVNAIEEGQSKDREEE